MKKVLVTLLIFAVLHSLAAFSMEPIEPAKQEYCQEELDNLYRDNDDKKIPLYLVIGSNRKSHGLGPVYSVINDIKSSNENYEGSFEQVATTMDLVACADKTAQHIVGDAEKYCFKKYDIKCAYLERLPTFTDKSKLKTLSIDQLFKRENNVMGNIIGNIAQSMDAGAQLEIELHPYFMQVSGLTLEDRTKFWKVNPFHVIFDNAEMSLLAQQVQAATEKEGNLDILSFEQQKIKNLLNLYATHGLADSLKKNPEYNINKSDFEIVKKRFFDEYKTVAFLYQNLMKNMAQIQNILENSVIGALMLDLAVLQNMPHIKTYLEENGFSNVTTERTTSKRNGRKNVWMVTANKF